MKLKPLYVNGQMIGSARTWHDVAVLLSKEVRRLVSARDAQALGGEGPEGFYISVER